MLFHLGGNENYFYTDMYHHLHGTIIPSQEVDPVTQITSALEPEY
jgi:hypothetical protein